MTREEQKQRHDAMRAHKAQGHSMQEVADYFGVSKQTAQRVCNGISPQTDRRPQQYKNGWDDEKKEINAIRVINERAPMFEYVGGFTNTDGYAYIRCRSCGSVLHKSFVSIRHGKARCEICYKLSLEINRENRKKIEDDKKVWAKRGKARAKQLSFSMCERCGGLFYSERAGVKYCSKGCAKNYALKKDKRLKKLKGICVDRNITIEQLYNKSNGVCAICGGQCDWGDRTITDDGTFIVGALYPSIDHIKPVSKGGLHEWKNVQLAHFLCNSKKSNNISPPIPQK